MTSTASSGMEKSEKQSENRNESSDFEAAVSATGFGKFNFLLLCVALPSVIATVFETSTMSYVLPIAECDLQLTLFDKGILNAITYGGMITSAIFWGYAADRYGRRKLLIIGFLLDVVCVLCGSISQTKYVLMTFKYLGGLLMSGPYAVLMTYVTEFHGTKHRSRVLMCTGIFSSMAIIILPFMAWGILPQDWTINISNLLVLRSWQIFVAATAIPGLLAGIVLIFLPESPKFLMSQGRNIEAYQTFQKIYSINFGKPKEEYPIKKLVEEIPQKVKSNNSEKLANSSEKEVYYQSGYDQIKPMFHKPYLGHSILVYSIQFCILMGLNTFRLWLPQLFTSISNYETDYLSINLEGGSSLCEILEYSVNKSKLNIAATQSDDDSFICESKVSDEMYINTIIVGVSGLIGYLVAGAIINALGNKLLIIIVLSISGTCALALFWSKSSIITLILSCVITTIASIGSTAVVGVAVNLFPTTLRSTIVSILMMFGRLGALIGNLLFPICMSFGCLPPFVMISVVMLASSLLAILLPKTHKNPLK